MTAMAAIAAGAPLRAARRLVRGLALLAVAAGLLGALDGRADTLDQIRQRGTLVVGVKQDVPLWGMLNPASGQPEGLEPDLAADLARRIGVRLRLVGVQTGERVEAVAGRRVDVLVATLSVTPERTQRLRLVSPTYYASGANILARRESVFRQWSDLRNRRVCGRLGAFYNRAITVTYGVDIVPLHSNALGMAALRDGRCDALLYDDTNIVALLQEPRWSTGFEMPLKTLFPTPWAIALHKEEAGSRLDDLVSRAVVDWHREGLLLALERKWGVPASGYAQRMNAQWNRRQDAVFVCGDKVSGATPQECL